jgi:hypothetical protein
MKFTALLSAACVFGILDGAAAGPLACSGGEISCEPLKKLFGACDKSAPPEMTCRTEEKRFAGAAGAGRTVYTYYEPPAGYAFDESSARGIVSDGRGTHGVDASIAPDRRLYCLWAAAGNESYDAGYCEVKVRLVR